MVKMEDRLMRPASDPVLPQSPRPGRADLGVRPENSPPSRLEPAAAGVPAAKREFPAEA